MEMFKYILILLSGAVVFIVLCRRLRLPPILGYLCVGILMGPGGLKWLPSIEELHELAEFGVVFLMFTLGLEFSIPRLMSTKRILIGVGGLQVASCTLVGTLGGYFFGLGIEQSFIIGGALALSSTAVVVKQLADQKEQLTDYGSLSINILLFQDLTAVFFLIIIPALSGENTGSLHITFLITMTKGVLACFGMALIGLWILRPLFHEVAKSHSTELFMMATLLVALSAAGITHYLGLSMALGAFLAGLMLGETEFRHQIEMDIRPFRDVLLGLFFVVIGAYLELDLLPEIWMQILIIMTILIIGKTLLVMLTSNLIGKTSALASLRSGIILAHGGEFGFVVLTEAIAYNLLEASQRPPIFAAIVLSVMLAPLMIRFNKQISLIFFKKKSIHHAEQNPQPSHQLSEHAAELTNHVILCGFGRVGQILSRFLDQEDISWLALDLDPMRISKTSIAGEHSFYGNATNPETLSAAGLSRARMVVLTFSDEAAALEVLNHVRGMRIDLPVFVRTKDDSNLESFQNAGATEVVPESLEGSIMLASHLLLTLGVPTEKIMSKVRRVHTDRYEILRGFYKGHDDLTMIEDKEESRRSLYSICVTDNSYAIGKQISDILEDTEGATVRSITRDNNRFNDPSPDMVINDGDVLVIFATPEAAVLLEEKILGG